jgi:predicted transposase YbfD/YdcC
MPNLFASRAFVDDLGFNIKELGNTYDVKGLNLRLLDLIFKKMNELKKRANSSEIKIFNNVLKQIDRFPDVKKAYYEYKNEQKAILDSTIVHEDNEYNAGRNEIS